MREVVPQGRGLGGAEPMAIVEAFELEDYPFGLALQWHPELMTETRAHLAMFRGLVDAAAGAPTGHANRQPCGGRNNSLKRAAVTPTHFTNME